MSDASEPNEPKRASDVDLVSVSNTQLALLQQLDEMAVGVVRDIRRQLRATMERLADQVVKARRRLELSRMASECIGPQVELVLGFDAIQEQVRDALAELDRMWPDLAESEPKN